MTRQRASTPIAAALAMVAMTIGACIPTTLRDIPENAIIVDSRTRTEYSGGHLACAKSLPWYDADDPEKAAALGDKSRPIIVYCLSGHRSTIAKERLEAQGFREVYDGGSMDSLRRLIAKRRPSSGCAVYR